MRSCCWLLVLLFAVIGYLVTAWLAAGGNHLPIIVFTFGLWVVLFFDPEKV